MWLVSEEASSPCKKHFGHVRQAAFAIIGELWPESTVQYSTVQYCTGYDDVGFCYGLIDSILFIFWRA